MAVAGTLCCAFPQIALATYAEVTDSYPATQDVTPSGDAVPASKIPDGSYPITASTSSYMCRMTDCTLTVKGGKMAATFTMSNAYTRIYLGTAEEAARHTNADGTDDSAYYKGTPPDGYVAHVYTLPVSELNHKMTIATYAGGTKTRKWFTRTVCFNSSAEVERAVAAGKSEQADDNKNSQANDSEKGVAKPSSDRPAKPRSGAGKTGGSSSSSTPRPKEATAEPTGSGRSAGSKASGAVSGDTTGSGAVASPSGPESARRPGKGPKKKEAHASSGGPARSAEEKAEPRAGPQVVSLTPAQTATLAGGELPDADGATDDEADDGTAYHVVLGVVVAAIAVLAVVLGISLRRIRKLRTNFGRKG